MFHFDVYMIHSFMNKCLFIYHKILLTFLIEYLLYLIFDSS